MQHKSRNLNDMFLNVGNRKYLSCQENRETGSTHRNLLYGKIGWQLHGFIRWLKGFFFIYIESA